MMSFLPLSVWLMLVATTTTCLAFTSILPITAPMIPLTRHYQKGINNHYGYYKSTTVTLEAGKIKGDSTASMSPFYQPRADNATTAATTNDRNNNIEAILVHDNNSTDENTTTTTTTLFSSISDVITGIGGQGGVVYDVNKLKRNLLQETMRHYKQNLLQFLIHASTTTTTMCSNDYSKTTSSSRRNNIITEQDIVDKLAALVQGSPVRTTTDSNLLDGTWYLVLQSQAAWVSDLRDTHRQSALLQLRQQQQQQQSQSQQQHSLVKKTTASANKIPVNTRLEKPIRNKEHGSYFWKTRRTIQTYHLEDLPPEVDPHVIEETVWCKGLLRKYRRSTVTGLTRRALTIEPGIPQWFLLGKYPIFRKVTAAAAKAAKRQKGTSSSSSGSSSRIFPTTETLEVIYLDVDLCILAKGKKAASYNNSDVSDNNAPDQRSFAVYTKDASALVTQVPWRRRLRGVGNVVLRIIVPWRDHKSNWKKRRHGRRVDGVDGDLILQEFGFDNDQGKLRVLKIGDLKEYDESWDGATDPFAHLSADERQEILKGMNMKEISQAGKQKLKTGRRRRRGWLSTLPVFGRRRTFYRGHDNNSDLKP